jgi:hypothetical protein
MDFNLDRFTGRLPYASEIFGSFQPLLGWKSRLIQNQLLAGMALPDFPRVVTIDAPPNSDHVRVQFAPESELEMVDGGLRAPNQSLKLFEDRADPARQGEGCARVAQAVAGGRHPVAGITNCRSPADPSSRTERQTTC